MKSLKAVSIFFALLFTTASLLADAKRYEVKSGIIEYQITQSGNMMGVVTQGKGSAKTLFKEWGNIEVHTEETETTTMGMQSRDKMMTKIDNGKVFVVDFDQQVIYQYTPEMLVNSKHKELAKTAKEMLASMGAKKIGEEKLQGYKCEVWEMMQVKLWLHKGIMLKSEANIMGMKHTTVATKIDLDTSVSDNELKLPDFPIQKAGSGLPPAQNGEEMQVPQLTPEQMQQMQEMMKSFSMSGSS